MKVFNPWRIFAKQQDAVETPLPVAHDVTETPLERLEKAVNEVVDKKPKRKVGRPPKNWR